MRERPPPETERSPRPGEASGDQNGPSLGKRVDAEPSPANRERQAESRLDPHLAHIGNHWRVWNGKGWLLGVFETKSAACAAILRERRP